MNPSCSPYPVWLMGTSNYSHQSRDRKVTVRKISASQPSGCGSERSFQRFPNFTTKTQSDTKKQSGCKFFRIFFIFFQPFRLLNRMNLVSIPPISSRRLIWTKYCTSKKPFTRFPMPAPNRLMQNNTAHPFHGILALVLLGLTARQIYMSHKHVFFRPGLGEIWSSLTSLAVSFRNWWRRDRKCLQFA